MSITEEYTRIGRGINKTMYHYKLQNLNDISKIEYYKTINDITTKYGISRGNVYLMIKSAGDTEIKRRKYAHLTIERII